MGIGIAILFVLLGLYLIQKEDKTAIIVGYANVIFFSGIILLAVIKLFKKQ
ncbi:hypothetical protein C8C84_2649 [Flavobacterium sp. 102]|nr:hypothetical protein C8C84_2649 [Flavobacterium sp. 102]